MKWMWTDYLVCSYLKPEEKAGSTDRPQWSLQQETAPLGFTCRGEHGHSHFISGVETMWMNGWNTEWNLLAQTEKSQPCVVNSLIFGIEFLHLMAAVVSVTILVLEGWMHWAPHNSHRLFQWLAHEIVSSCHVLPQNHTEMGDLMKLILSTVTVFMSSQWHTG